MVFKSKAIHSAKNALQRFRDRWKLRGFEAKALSRPVKLAVIGSGKAASYHLDALRFIKNLEVTCLVNRGRSDPGALLKQYKIPVYSTSLADALLTAKFETAIVAVPPDVTADVALALAQRDIRCLIEKPVAISSQEAEKLLAIESHTLHSVGYNRRFYTSVLRAREIMNSLGDPYSMHLDAPEPMFKIINSSGAPALENRLITNTTHGLDLFTLFCGKSVEVRPLFAQKRLGCLPISFQTGIRFENGCNGTFVSHWHSPGEWIAVLYGHGYRVIINLNRNECVLHAEKSQKSFSVGIEDRLAKPGVYLQDWTFLESVAQRVQGPSPLCSLREAYETLRLGEAILRSTSA